MGLADFPYLVQRRIRAVIECYRSTSLYYRNIGFFGVGILWGSVWGSYKRKAKDATNADCSAVHLTFYDIPTALSLQQQDSQPSCGERTDRHLPPQRKRAFENLWEEAARLLQRQPGYTYTQMFRRLMPDEGVEDASLGHVADAELERNSSGRKGVGAGIETPTDSEANQEQRVVDYVELRVWENEESHKNADMAQAALIKKIRELGVKMDTGLYRRVFDDAFVRLIQ